MIVHKMQRHATVRKFAGLACQKRERQNQRAIETPKKRDCLHVLRLAKDKSVTLNLKMHPREMNRTQKQWTVIVKLVQENSL